MYVASVNNTIYPAVRFGAKKHNVPSDADNNKHNESKTVDVLRKQLMNLAIASMALVGTTGMTSCVTNEPDFPDTFIEQCPRVDTPVKSIEGLVPKADILFHGIGLLDDGVSIMDVDKIQVVDEQTGDKMIFKTNDESSEDKILMDYTLVKPDGSTAESVYEMYDNGYGAITCVLNKADGIDYQYKRFTQYSYNFNDIYETVNGKDKCNAIIKKAGDGRIKRVREDNGIEYYQVNTTLK